MAAPDVANDAMIFDSVGNRGPFSFHCMVNMVNDGDFYRWCHTCVPQRIRFIYRSTVPQPMKRSRCSMDPPEWLDRSGIVHCIMFYRNSSSWRIYYRQHRTYQEL